MNNISQEELRKKHKENGVIFIDETNVFLREDTIIGKGTIIEPFVIFGNNVTIRENCKILGFCHIADSTIKENAEIGPFARMRGNSEIGVDAHIGNFVEINRSKVEDKVKALHLSYIGDAIVGEKTNIGAGVITCNYDGYNKNKTSIGKNCFIGSRATLIAPIDISNGAFVAAGTVVNKSVGENDLIIGRCEIIEKKEGALKYHEKKIAAKENKG